MSNSDPLVSVVIPTYDRPEYLSQAIAGVASQTYSPIELVVVDDSSPTAVRDVFLDAPLDQFAESQFIRHDDNRGVNAARNTGIDNCSGELIAFLDDDDRWEPEKTSRQVSALETSPTNAGVVYCSTKYVRDGEIRGTFIRPRIDGDITKRLLCENIIGPMSCVMVKRDLIAETGKLDERFPSWADLEWYIRLSLESDFERIADPLVIYSFDSHGRISDSFAKTEKSYRLFVDEFQPVAASYGRLFERKVLAWAAYRAARSAQNNKHYLEGRNYLLKAVRRYPFEPKFYKFLIPALGGRKAYVFARKIWSRLLSDRPG